MRWTIVRNLSKDIKIIRKVHTGMLALESNICRYVLYILGDFLKNIPNQPQSQHSVKDDIVMWTCDCHQQWAH